MSKQYSKVTSKLDYKRLYHKTFNKNLELQKRLREANEEIDRVIAESKKLAESMQYAYLAETK